MKNSTTRSIRLLISLVLVLSVYGCAVQKTSASLELREIGPGIIQGYLEQTQLPNGLLLVPPPPEVGSAGWQLDQEMATYYMKLDDNARKNQAIMDADLSFPAALESFNPRLPFPLSEETTPVTYMILRRSLADAGLSTYSAKTHYKRSRPFMVNGTPTLIPDDEEMLSQDGSYPSGHTAIGWAWALILTELFPEHTDAILDRGEQFGVSRNILNVHWYSDVVAGRIMGAATVARLHADPQFAIDIEAAKKELRDFSDE